MNYDNYNRYQNLKRKIVNPRLDQNCAGQCNSNMIKLGLCNCAKINNKKPKKKNAFFQYRFWITVMIIMVIASWFFHISLLPSFLIILLIYFYFQYLKK